LDYSAYSAFNTVERFTRSGVLNTVNIGEFLRSQGNYSSEVELVAIVRRIDTNGDCNITNSELAEFMRPLAGVKSVYASPSRTASTRYSSPVRVRTASLLESPVSAALDRSLSLERKSYLAASPVYSPYRYSRYYDPLYYDYPYYSRYGSPYAAYPYTGYPYSAYPYSRYPYVRENMYFSASLGRYVYV
jgi:hypothetical protein